MSGSSKDIDYKAGKKRWPAYLFLIVALQGLNIVSTCLCIYAIITLNWQLCLILATIIFLQSFIRRSQKFIEIVNKYFQPLNYFNSFKRIYEQQIPQQQPAIFSFHPHSILGYCMITNMNTDNSKMSHMIGLASRFVLNMPVVALPLKLWGVQSVDSDNFLRLMKQKKTIGLLPGGYQQATLTSPKQLRVFIKSRKGFIKYALQNGYTIYPVLTLNQHKAFWTFDGLKKFRLMLNKFKIPAALFGNGFLWFFLPLDMDMITIVGKGIKLSSKQITNEDIQFCHKQYIQQIERIHAKYSHLSNQVPLAIH